MTSPPLAVEQLSGPGPLAGLIVLIGLLLLVDLKFFARGRDPSFKEGAVWSVGWLILSVAFAIPLLVLGGSEEAINYTTVYFIERSLSLDNLFVFLLLFSYFGVPVEYRARLLFWGIVFALVLRGLAILGGVALIKQFHFVIYILGIALLILAYRVLKGVDENVDPDKNLFVRLTRRLFPVTDEFKEHHWFWKDDGGTRFATPLFLCLVAIVFADIAFAIDSIPAAFGITRDSFVIFMGNAFALLGLRALFVLVEGLIKRFRYLDQTIAIVLGLVAVKLLVEDIYKVGPVTSLLIVLLAFAIGIIASLIADSRDPHSDEKRAEREQSMQAGKSDDDSGGTDENGGTGGDSDPKPEGATDP